MSKTEMFEVYIKCSGKTKTYLARKAGISLPTLYRLIDHPEKCTFDLATFFKRELALSDDQMNIFLP